MAKRVVEFIQKLSKFLTHDLWHIEVTSDSRLHRFGLESLRVTHLVIKGLKDDNCGLHAAALTFRTLMALIPFMVIFIAFAQALGMGSVHEFILEKMHDMPTEFQTFISTLLEDVSQINLVGMVGVSGVVFLYVIFKLLSSIEESFNQIWGVSAPRNIADKLRNYLSVLVVAPALMLLAQVGSSTLVASSGRVEWLGPLVSMLFQVIPILMITAAFILIFMFLPNTRVPFKAAMTGGLVSALLAIAFQLMMIAVGSIILKKFMLYGSLATVLVFLFWLNISWTILLFGAELTFAIQNKETYLEEQRAKGASTVSRLWVAVATMKEALRVFDSDETSLDALAFARKNNIPVRLTYDIIQLLVRDGFLGELSTEQPYHYVLLQPPENVTAKKVCELLVADGASPEELGLKDADVTADTFAALGMQNT